MTIGCHKEADKHYFNGEIKLVDDTQNVTELSSDRIFLEGAFFGYPSVCDSLIIFWNPSLPGAYFSIFNLNTGEYMGDFCKKGSGPEEFSTLPLIFRFYKENGAIKTMLFAPNEEKLLLWNITESVEKRITVYDSVISYKWEKENISRSYVFMFRLEKDTMLAYVPSRSLTIDDGIATLPFYQKRTIYTNKLIRNYDIYKASVRSNADENFAPNFFLSSFDCIKPDGSKIVQGMIYLAQINIIDIETGQITGYRIKNTPDFSFFKTDKPNLKGYYTRIQADDEYIYALYSGEYIESRSSSSSPQPHIIHVFDWEGNLKRKLELDHPTRDISLDHVNNILYTMDVEAEEVYSYDLNKLNFK
jgi:hypothetical protein